MMSFFRNLVGVKKGPSRDQRGRGHRPLGPQSATEAELRTMEQHLDELGRRWRRRA
jgi:hypothetical protein